MLIWMSCTGWKYTTMPGMAATALEPLNDFGDEASRSLRALSVIASRPALAVGLSGVTPTTEMTPVTSGVAAHRIDDPLLQALHFP